MTPEHAAEVLVALHGAYPRVEIDEAVALVWKNSLSSTDREWAMKAAQEWIATQTWFPTVAEFNSLVTRLRQVDANERPALAAHGNIRCNGTGWIDRGSGNEPCPACNPWMRKQWSEGNLAQHRKPPADYIAPPPCRPSHAGEGSQICDRQTAMRAVLNGMRQHYTEIGLDEAEAAKRIAKRMPTVVAAVSGVPV